MNSPSKQNSDSEQDYPPPWPHEQHRPIVGHSASLPIERRTHTELIDGGTRAFSNDPAWLRRGLKPDVVPEPPAGFVDFWPMVLRLGGVCSIVVAVVAAVVLLFSGKPSVQGSARAKTAPSIASTGGTLLSAQSPGAGQAVPDNKSAKAAQSLPQAQPPPAQRPALPAEMPASASAETSLSPRSQTAPIPAPRPATSVPTNRPEISLDKDEIIRLINRGKDLLNDGDFAAARLLFERAANAGSAEAALALGSTYDPVVIKRLGAVAVTPDIAQARKWYHVAADRGSVAALGPLANLERAR